MSTVFRVATITTILVIGRSTSFAGELSPKEQHSYVDQQSGLSVSYPDGVRLSTGGCSGEGPSHGEVHRHPHEPYRFIMADGPKGKHIYTLFLHDSKVGLRGALLGG